MVTVCDIRNCFYFPHFLICLNCLNTFYPCPCAQEQLGRSYQEFLSICIIVNIPYSVSLKFKYLTTNTKQMIAPSSYTHAGEIDTICIIARWRQGRLQSVGPLSINSPYETKSRSTVRVALFVWQTGRRPIQHWYDALICAPISV